MIGLNQRATSLEKGRTGFGAWGLGSRQAVAPSSLSRSEEIEKQIVISVSWTCRQLRRSTKQSLRSVAELAGS